MEFWQQSEGEWFSQRTSHDVAQSEPQSVKSTLNISLAIPSEQDMAKAREVHHLEAIATLKQLTVVTYADIRRDGDAPTGNTTLYLVPDESGAESGRLLGANSSSSYQLGEDGVLTIASDRGDLRVEERIWFESPNLRLRTSSVFKAEKLVNASFFSEIRRVQAPPKTT